jgi:MFS family permease
LNTRVQAPAVPESLPIRRNTILLAGTMAMGSAMMQLAAAFATLTFVEVTGSTLILGLGPAIFLLSASAASFPAGRAMDRFGRMPVISAGFVGGTLGTIATGFAVRTGSIPLVVLGFILIGFSQASFGLARSAGGDMYPPDRRARGIGYVLFGAVFGAILGPSLFGPLLSGEAPSGDTMSIAWFAASAFTLAGLVMALAVRPDPRRIAEILSERYPSMRITPPADGKAAPLREIIARPGVKSAMLAAMMSQGVMVGVMTLTGFIVVSLREHDQATVFPIIGAHVIGMFGLVLFVGPLIDRIGRKPALGGGLLLMGLSSLSLLWIESPAATAVPLFLLGLGWNFSFVAATAEIVDLTMPWERGRLVGATDLCAQGCAATLAVLGGLGLSEIGVGAVAIGALVLSVVPAATILVSRRRPVRAVPAESAS